MLVLRIRGVLTTHSLFATSITRAIRPRQVISTLYSCNSSASSRQICDDASFSDCERSGGSATPVSHRHPWHVRCSLASERCSVLPSYRCKRRCRTAAASSADPSGALTAAQRALPPAAVHIYWLDTSKVPDGIVYGRYMELLSLEEQEYAAAAKAEAVQRDRILSRALVRTVLAKYCSNNVKPQDLVFSRGPRGKPEVAGPQEVLAGSSLHFNVSNTHGLQGCAVSCSGLVGLDIESDSRLTRRDPLALARRHFSPQELVALQGVSDEGERRQYFLRLWTLKEAYVKAQGRGIRAAPGLQSFTMSLDSASRDLHGSAVAGDKGPPPEVSAEPEAASIPESDGVSAALPQISFSSEAERDQEQVWRFVLLQPRPGFTAAVCMQRPIREAIAPADATEASAGAALSMWQTMPLLYDEAIAEENLLLLASSQLS